MCECYFPDEDLTTEPPFRLIAKQETQAPWSISAPSRVGLTSPLPLGDPRNPRQACRQLIPIRWLP